MQSMMRQNPTNRARTLDSEHQERCAEFERAAELRRQCAEQIAQLEEELGRCDGDWAKTRELRDRILQKRAEYKSLRREYDEIGYYSETAPILFQYYESFKPPSKAAKTPQRAGRKSAILTFFARGGEVRGAEEPAACLELPDQKGSLLERFLEKVDKNHIKQFVEEDRGLCPHCGTRGMQVIGNEGVSFCTACHHSEKVMLEVEKPYYKEPPTDITHYAYKRINHFNEWLNQTQGKEFTDIPPHVIDSILLELKKQKIHNMATLTNRKVREILRKLSINKYYEHIPYIMYKLTRISPPKLGEELEEQMRQMFFAVQMPYLRHCPVTRKNFLSYSYVMHKQLQLLGRPDLLKHFPLLKSREKLHQQEQIWKNICADLGWKFQPSI